MAKRKPRGTVPGGHPPPPPRGKGVPRPAPDLKPVPPASGRAAADLSDKELSNLAAQLRGTTRNVYGLMAFVGCDPDEAIFGRLRRERGVFRCEVCDTWKDVGLEEAAEDLCTDCADA